MKLTIITISLNNARGLKKTLESVASQTDQRFEHIIIDGGSSDGTLDTITRFPHVTKWVSEPDGGIFNAMNKGIRMASGQYILFLNSGDTLHDKDVVRKFVAMEITSDIVTGIECMPDGKLVYPPDNDKLTYSFFYEDTLLHQSSFIRKDAFQRYGLYREDYCIVSDWEWFFRTIVRENATYQSLNFIISDFEGDGISSNPMNRELHDKEREQVRYEILPRVRADFVELLRLSSIETEYNHLKNGTFGIIVKVCLILKKLLQ